MNKRIAFLAIAALLYSIANITALDDTAQKQEAQQYRVKTELMEVRTVVTDKQGRIIENLKKDDFELLENDHAQTISFFSISQVENGRNQPAAAKPTVPDKTAESPRIKERLIEAPVRTTLLYVDNLHLSFSSLNAVKQALRRFVNEQMSDQDMVALATSRGTLGIAQQFTRNRQLLRYGIEQIQIGPIDSQSYFTSSLAAQMLEEPPVNINDGQIVVPQDCPRTSGGQIADPCDPRCQRYLDVPNKWIATRLAIDIVRNREHIECPCSLLRAKAQQMALQTLSEASYSRKETLSILRDFAAQMTGLPGKRMIVAFSDGFTMRTNSGDISNEETQSAINRAVRSGVVIYSIDAKGLQGPAWTDAGRNAMTHESNLNQTLDREPCPDEKNEKNGRNDCPVNSPMKVRDPSCDYPKPGDWVTFASMSEREEENGLSTIAEGTGGKMYNGSNNLGEELGRAFDANRFYYVLSYYLPQGSDLNKFRSIKVRIRNHPEYTIRTARGFLPSDLTVKPEDETAKTPQQRLLHAIRSPLPATDLNVSAQADFLETQADNNQVTLTVYVDGDRFQYREQDRRKGFNLEILYAMYDSSGKQVDGASSHVEGNLTAERLAQAKISGYRFSRRLPLKPGAYQARIGVREEGTDRMGTASAWVEVPEPARDKMSMSGLMLHNPLDTDPAAKEGMNVSELEQIKMVQGIPLYEHDDFCDYQFRVYRDKQIENSDLSVRTEVLNDGKPLKQEQWKPISPEEMDADSKGWFDLDGEVDLGGFKPGVYELRVSVKDAQSNKTIQRSAVFAVE